MPCAARTANWPRAERASLFSAADTRLVSFAEGSTYLPERQHGCPTTRRRRGRLRGLSHERPPPIAHARRGETPRRYLDPRLDDGRAPAFCGRHMIAKRTPEPGATARA